MSIFLIALTAIVYLLVAMAVKAYYKLNRWDHIMPDDPYIIGCFWPIYIGFRLIAWPLVITSTFIENKFEALKEAKSQTKRRISSTIDRDLQEAEKEVDSFLSQDKERYNSL